jgi:hypothetical protein
MKINTTITMTRAELDILDEIQGTIADQFGKLAAVDRLGEKNFTMEVKATSKLQAVLYRLRLKDELEVEYRVDTDVALLRHMADIITTAAEAAGPLMRTGSKVAELNKQLEDMEVSVETEGDI